MTDTIRQLAREKNALILAHNYQPGDIQDIADVTGDSLELARIAARNDASLIVFCGVYFMAESAHILSPLKKVIIPEPAAGCPMADMAAAKDLEELKKKHPGVPVVTYINSTADVKALSDVICTSSNAAAIVENIPGDSIIFVPDKNLGAYIQRFTKKKIIPWKGFCPTHERLTADDISKAMKAHPGAMVMVHPECSAPVIDLADEVLSTGKMISLAAGMKGRDIIVGTESGIIHKLQQVGPENRYFPASDAMICPNMKKISLQKLHDALVGERTEVRLDPVVAGKARKALDAMLEMSGR